MLISCSKESNENQVLNNNTNESQVVEEKGNVNRKDSKRRVIKV